MSNSSDFVFLKAIYTLLYISLSPFVLMSYVHASTNDSDVSNANAHGTRDSISLISYAGCLSLSAVYFSENSL